MEDRELLREYVENRNDAAFADLVHRHLDLVHSTALRVVRESQMAKDVAQSVFIQLARKAASIRQGNALPGWLYRATCYEAASAVRAEQRRRHRETQAMKWLDSGDESSSVWAAIAPLLDEAMGKLGTVEQDAVVLRFFRDRSWREVGAALGISEDAAQKRVGRALESMRTHFARQGVKVASGALGAALAAHAVQAAPAGIGSALASAALSAGAAGSTGFISILTQALFMTKTTAITVAILAVSAALAPILLHRRATPDPAPAIVSPLTVSPTAPDVTAESIATPAPPTPQQPPAPAREPLERLLFRAGTLPPFTPVQIEFYVEQNKRNAESLLAAHRIGTNLAYLNEAASRFPTDPDVQYAVISSPHYAEVRRPWIDAYKASSPDNALAWYFSALDHFKSGQTAQAVAELSEGTRKPAFRAELAPTLQAVEEMHISAGRLADEAKVAAFQSCAQVPHLEPMRELARAMQETVQQFRQTGDTASADSLAGMGLVLGGHLSAGGGSQTLMSQLVGIGVEKMFLRQLDLEQGHDLLGRPLAEVSEAINERGATLKSLAQSVSKLLPSLGDTELANYMERVKLYGEGNALAWLKTKHEQP